MKKNEVALIFSKRVCDRCYELIRINGWDGTKVIIENLKRWRNGNI